MSPYIDGQKTSLNTLPKSKRSIHKFDLTFKNMGGNIRYIRDSIDVVAFQDGHVHYARIEDFIRVNKSLADQNQITSWINSETFDPTCPSSFCRSNGTNWRYKLKTAAHAGISEAITFEFSHFMSPQSAYPQGGHLYNRYVDFLKEKNENCFSKLYLDKLTQEVVPFWEKHSIDSEYGGFYTCINSDHEVYDTDKFLWLQARQVWTFTLYDRLEKKKIWFEIAQFGSIFLRNLVMTAITIGFFPSKRWSAVGNAYNIFPHTFACMAMGKIHHITGEKK